MEHDFLDGIDEQFQRLMKLYGTGKGSGRPGAGPKDDRLTFTILEQLVGLSAAQKEEVLSYIHSLKEKLDE